MSRRRILVPVVVFVATIGLAVPALAYWAAQSTNASGVAATASLGTPTMTGASSTPSSVQFTVVAPSGIAPSGYRVDRTSPTAATNVCPTLSTGAGQCTDSTAATGNNTYSVFALLGAWESATPGSITVNVAALAAPTITGLTTATDTGSSSTDGITSVVKPSLVGSAPVNATVTLFEGATQIGSGTANGTGGWTVAPTNNLSEGSHAITAKATVGANTSAASGPFSVVVDTTAPTGLTISTSITGQKATFSGSASHVTNDVLSVTVTVCATNSFPCASAQATVSGNVNATTGAWTSAQTANLGNGATHFAQAVQLDLAGNKGTVTSAQFTS
jgi:hypothetical protein